MEKGRRKIDAEEALNGRAFDSHSLLTYNTYKGLKLFNAKVVDFRLKVKLGDSIYSQGPSDSKHSAVGKGPVLAKAHHDGLFVHHLRGSQVSYVGLPLLIRSA